MVSASWRSLRLAHECPVDFNNGVAAQDQVVRMPACDGERLVQRELFCLLQGGKAGGGDFLGRWRDDLERDAEQGQ